MKLRIIILSVFALSILSCGPEGPETGCHLNPTYDLDVHSINLSFIYNIHTEKEVKNADLTTKFIFQYNQWEDIVPLIFPYNYFFINEISFPSSDSVRFDFKYDSIFTYSFTREDCLITVESSDMPLSLALQDSGESISESRFAIFEHDRTPSGKDTFLFLDFVLAPNIPIDDVLKNYVHDHPGTSDTMGLQSVFNGIHN